jgi:hypothetical protein
MMRRFLVVLALAACGGAKADVTIAAPADIERVRGRRRPCEAEALKAIAVTGTPTLIQYEGMNDMTIP